jgi:hypothetical protein
MDKKTLAALKGSIANWEGVVAGKGYSNCSLCDLFNYAGMPDEERCDGCPIKEKTGRRYCVRTPYEKWEYAPEEGDEKRRAAVEELAFLKSFLPQDTP